MKRRLFRKPMQRGRLPSTAVNDKRPAFSYYAADQTRDTSVKNRSRKSDLNKGEGLKRLRMLPTVLAVSAITLSIVYSTTLSPEPTVLFAGEPSPYYSVQEYQDIAFKVISMSFSNKSKLTINTGRIEQSILAASPELDAAKLTMPVIGRRPTLSLHARQPALILTTKTNALILDSSGRAVSDTKRLPSELRSKLLTLQDESGLDIKIGSQAVTATTVSFIENIRRQLTNKNMEISRLVLPTTPNEIDIYITGLPYYVKADVTGNARLQMGAFIAVKDGVGTSAPAEYMDVRVEEKVFYK